nr:coadhesin-like isoform X2 [Crassostrea gigas]
MDSSILQHLVIFTTLAIFTDSPVQAFLCASDEHLVQSWSGYPVMGNCVKCSGSSSVNVGEWGRCSVTCGHGSQSRTIIKVNPCGRQSRRNETRSCNTHTCPVNGGWGTWGQFTPCGKSCGGGIQIRFRSCDHPSPSNGGLSCIGDSLQTASCNSQQCPVLVTITNPTVSVTSTSSPSRKHIGTRLTSKRQNYKRLLRLSNFKDY